MLAQREKGRGDRAGLRLGLGSGTPGGVVLVGWWAMQRALKRVLKRVLKMVLKMVQKRAPVMGSPKRRVDLQVLSDLLLACWWVPM